MTFPNTDISDTDISNFLMPNIKFFEKQTFLTR